MICEVEERLERDGRLGINIGVQEGLILQSLCALPNVEKVVEIGTQYGCSTLWMAQALGAKGQIECFEKDPKCIENARKSFEHPEFLKTSCQVNLNEGDARDLLSQIESKGPFDLIFIDANKAAYGDYLAWSLKNINAFGIIVIDNVFLFGTVFEDECPENTPKKMWKVMKDLIDQQLRNPSFQTSLVPTQEGLLISVKKDGVS